MMITSLIQLDSPNVAFSPDIDVLGPEKSRSQKYASWYRDRTVIYSRNSVRIPYPRQVALIPLDEQNRPLIEKVFLVTGKNISALGVAFTHALPIELSRAVIVFVEEDVFDFESRIVELRWCRFTREGNYISGGRLLPGRVPEVRLPADWRSLPRG